MIAPILKKEYKITQKYGNKLIINGKEYYKQFGLASHNGVDIGTPVGTELLAGVEGTITVKNDGKAGYGLHVAITKTRPDGFTGILYAHLDSTPLKTGDVVKVGQLIGKSGNSGGSFAPHLHLGLRLRNKEGLILTPDNGNKGWIDAMPYFEKGRYRL